ncbi:MAG: hypothetical protein IJ405_00110 [Lachnospiraceae bacterium]|nr:hypothetical protein [Lachnospiraceae bacterium]
MRECKIKGKLWPYIILGMVCILVYYLPYFILGQDAAFRITDFLDDEVVQYLLNVKYMFAPSDTIVAEWFSGAPLASIQPPSFFLILFFKLLPFYQAIVAISLFGTVAAYIGMLLLCNKLLGGKQKYISFMAAILFCILPYYPPYGLSSVGIPLVVWACINLYEETNNLKSEKGWQGELRYLSYYLVCVFYALSSSLVWAGYFVVGFTVLVAIILLIKRKKSGVRIVIAAILMAGTYCITFRETIVNILFETYVSHRSDPNKIYIASDFVEEFVDMFKYGQYHVPSLHTYIMAFSFCVILIGLIFYKKLDSRTRRKTLLVATIWVSALFIAVFHAFYNCKLGLVVRKYLGPLESFQLDRIYWIYPTLWYVELALATSVFFQVAEVVLNLLVGLHRVLKEKFTEKIKRNLLKIFKATFTFIVTLFLANYIIHHINSTEYYANVQKVLGKETTEWTYRDFYDHELFAEVAEYIGRDQSTYRIGCVGFVPAIAQVNGFYTVDGYSTNYPLEYKQQFREVIAKELEKSELIRAYYDNWGNRCYLLSAELGTMFQIGKEENIVLQNFEINVEALKALGCDYIFSAVGIENVSEMGMKLLNIFSTEESRIEVYVYEL